MSGRPATGAGPEPTTCGYLAVGLCHRNRLQCGFGVSGCTGRAAGCGSRATGGRNRFPQTDYFFHSGFAGWRGYSPSDDWENRSEFRNFYNLGREFRIEAARERAKEMAVFALIVLTSAWPVLYMVVTVVKLLSKGRP